MNIDNSKIIFTDKDTLQVPFTLKFSESKQKVKLLFERKEKQSYKLEILPNAITDFFEQTNDTLSYSFTTKELINYGSLKISVKGVEKYPIIVQLLSEKSVLIEEIFASSEQEFNFENLSPKKYLIRVILDENQNKKWDTGNFLKKQQPEKVYYFIKVIEIKENWFVNETFELN
jgi:hypothetical protein